MGEKLDLGQSFALLALIYFLFFSVNSMTYYAMSTNSTAMGVTARLADIFKMEEHKSKRKEAKRVSDIKIKIENAEFTWGFRVKEDQMNQQMKMQKNIVKLDIEQSNETVLSGINLDLKAGSFLVVVGKIGSGKTSLLYSILEETVHKEGSMDVCGRIAYVEQEPFIYSATIEENICFGLEFNRVRF